MMSISDYIKHILPYKLMKTTLMVRMRLSMTKRSSLRSLLVLCAVATFSIFYVIRQWDHLGLVTPVSDADGAQHFGHFGNFLRGKCEIKNFNRLQHISIVYTWVNGSLPCYRKMRKKAGGSLGGSRDREFNELMYSIRSLQKFIPWHKGNLYIVTPGHIPHWVDASSTRIKIINQDDLIPSYAKQFLPTFNTNVIEQFLYLIPGLSDLFMQVNDDCIFTKLIDPHEFFTCDGGIRLLHEKGSISHAPPTPKKGVWISSVLNTQQEMDTRWGDETRYYIKHAPFLYSRHAFERLHQIFDRPLYMTLKNKFRSRPDMNVPLLHHYYMTSQGSEELGIGIDVPPSRDMEPYKLVLLKDKDKKKLQNTFDEILSGSSTYKIITLNDEYTDLSVPKLATDFLKKLLPEPSEFERKPWSPELPPTIRMPGSCKVNETILPRFPERMTPSLRYQLHGYREARWALFMSGWLRGVGLAMGFMTAYFSCIIMIRSGTPKVSNADFERL